MRYRAGGRVSRAPFSSRVDRSWVCGRDALSAPDRRTTGRRQTRASERPYGRRARHGLQRRPSVLDRTCGSEPCPCVSLRVGNGLPHRRGPANGAAPRVDATGESGPVRGEVVCRYWTGAGARLCTTRGFGLDRQEQLSDQRGSWLVALPVGGHLQSLARDGSPGDRPVRHLYAVSRGVSDRCDRTALGR